MEARDELSGRTVGEFVLRERIGEGAFGAVYRCEQPLLGREAVVKVLHGRHRGRQVMIHRFLREARLASRLDHPYAAHVYAFGVEKDDGLLWIAMEMVHGTPLDRWLRERGPLALDELVPFFERIAEVVQTAHEAGIVHRDLKPSNVMVIERAGRLLPKLLDLGIAKLLAGEAAAETLRARQVARGLERTDPGASPTAETLTATDPDVAGVVPEGSLTHDGAAIGSPPYMAPEQWGSGAIGPRADLYSLGILAYEALAGRRPFVASTVGELAELHQSAPVPPLGPGFDPALDRFFARALAKRPEERPASALELAAALRGASGASEAPPVPAAGTGAIDFTAERQRHVRFVGREDVLARLDEWLLGPREAGWIVVTGGPGMGKSAILSAWLARREAAGAVVPHHFVRRQVADWDHPEVIAGSLAAQIEAAFPGLRDPEAKQERRLIELLGRVSKQLGGTGRLAIVVDGLDEARAESGENPLPRFLPHAVPAGIQILCAMRPAYPQLSWIEARSPIRRLDLDDRRWATSNEAVVRDFWETVAPEYQPPLPDATMAVAIGRADGNVLHAVMLHDALRDLPAAERHAERISRGLKELVGEVWGRAASQAAARAGLGLLCAAQEALSLDVLADLAGWSYEEKERFLGDARQLLLEEVASGGGAEAYRPRHDWVRELIAERLGAPAIRAHHETLSRRLAPWPVPGEAAARRYALRHALSHRAQAGNWAEAWRLAADPGFLEAKCRELGAPEAVADVARAAERCRASGDEARRRRFDDLARALEREAHWLRAAPEATAAIVWNRLRRSGWSADELDEQLQVPAAASFLRVRHGVTRASPAFVRNFVGHAGPVNACVVTADGRRVVSGSRDGALKVWELESGRTLATLEGVPGGVSACAVTADGRRVVAEASDGTLKVWEIESGRALVTLEGHTGGVNACAVTADGRRVVAATAGGTLQVWDLESGRALVTLDGHADAVNACAVTADGRRVISASADGTLKVWDLESGRALATLDGHADAVNACAVTADGRRVVSASADGTLQIWDLESGRALATLDGHADVVNACAVTADGRRVVSASNDDTLKIWDLESGRAMATLSGHTDAVRACAITMDGRKVISASADGTLKVWDLEGCTLAAQDGHADGVRACAVTADGRRAVSASRDRTLKVWDLETGRALATLEDNAGTCAVTADGRRVVSASGYRTLKVWDLESGRALVTLDGHAGWVWGCAVTADGRRVVSASEDRTLKVWDLESGRELVALEGHADGVSACAVTADGQRVISASIDDTLKVWDVESGRALVTLAGHTGRVWGCAVTADGQRVISASEDRTLKVWDLESGRALATLEGHTGGVSACAVTADGARVVSASGDGTLRVWDLESHACLFTHRGDAAYTAVAATATAIVAGDDAGTLWVLDWPSSMAR